MRLFDTPRAPNPRRVRWLMAEKGIEDIELVDLDIMAGAHKQPDYLDRAGVPQVPALEMDDGTTVTESIAICRYLESRYPQPNLFGRTPEEIAVVEMWTRRAEMLVAHPLMLGVRHSHPALAVLETQVPEVAEYNTRYGLAGLSVLDRQLEGRDWLAADRMTIADIVAFIGLDFIRLNKLRPPEELTNLARWADVMRARPAARLAP